MPGIKVKAPAWFKWTARVNAGILYIFAVNDGDGSGNDQFTISDKIESVKIINLEKDKTAQPLKSDTYSWSAEFIKNDVHIYTIKLK